MGSPSRLGFVTHKPLRRALPLALLFALAACEGTISDAARPGPTPGARPTTPGGGPGALCQGRTSALAPLRRLTRDEYDRTARDLLRDPSLSPARDFVFDAAIGPFRSNVSSPTTTPIAQEYMAAAEALANRAVGELGTLVPCASAPSDEAACARFIERFGRRAYRRPLDGGEADAWSRSTSARTRRGYDFTQRRAAAPGDAAVAELPLSRRARRRATARGRAACRSTAARSRRG